MTRTWDGLTSEVHSDYPHEIGIAIYLNESGRGWSYAAILPHSGTVIAWDGRYFEQHNMPAAKHRGALVDLAEWADRDVSASQIMAEQNGLWLPVLGSLLYPSWSLTQLAERLLRTRERDGAVGLAAQNDRPVAYYPTRANNTNANDE